MWVSTSGQAGSGKQGMEPAYLVLLRQLPRAGLRVLVSTFKQRQVGEGWICEGLRDRRVVGTRGQLTMWSSAGEVRVNHTMLSSTRPLRKPPTASAFLQVTAPDHLVPTALAKACGFVVFSRGSAPFLYFPPLEVMPSQESINQAGWPWSDLACQSGKRLTSDWQTLSGDA